jgi:hypothetical protein
MTRKTLAVLIGAITISGCYHGESQTAQDSKPATKAVAYIDPSQLLSPGQLEVDVMGPSPRFTELSLKFAGAMKNDPEWSAEFIRKNARPGEPLPYHEKMGLTKEEYDEFLDSTKHQSVVKIGSATLRVTQLSDGSLSLDGGKAMPELTGIEFDFAKDEVRTPHGVAGERDDGDAENAFLGDWNGAQWKSKAEDNPDAATKTSITVILGQLKASKRGILVCDAQVSGKTRKRLTHILNFDPPSDHK